jgi:hypothetical protein
MNAPQSRTQFLVAAALLGAMGLAFVYQGVSKGSPPSFLGAAILLAGAVFVIGWAMRRPHA